MQHIYLRYGNKQGVSHRVHQSNNRAIVVNNRNHAINKRTVLGFLKIRQKRFIKIRKQLITDHRPRLVSRVFLPILISLVTMITLLQPCQKRN